MPSSSSRPSVLIIDDGLTTRDLLSRILRNLDCHPVWFAGTPDDGLAAYDRYRPQVVFVDIEMPEKDGFEVLQELLRREPRQFVVMISAHSTLENVKKAMENGAAGFIVKPYSIAKLKDSLLKYARNRARYTPEDSSPPSTPAGDTPAGDTPATETTSEKT